jgi:hypothetical protein
MTFGIMTLGITTFDVTTFRNIAFRITPFNLIIIRITLLKKTLNKNLNVWKCIKWVKCAFLSVFTSVSNNRYYVRTSYLE